MAGPERKPEEVRSTNTLVTGLGSKSNVGNLGAITQYIC